MPVELIFNETADEGWGKAAEAWGGGAARWGRAIRIGGGAHHSCSWRGPGFGAVFVQPRITTTSSDSSSDSSSSSSSSSRRREQRFTSLDLVVTGTDAIGLRAVSSASYSFASAQSLTRAIYTNMWPDLVVAHGPQLEAQGVSGMLAAGFFDSQWRWGSPSVPCRDVER